MTMDRGTRVLRTVRMIAAATMTLWTGAAVAQNEGAPDAPAQTGTTAPPAQSPSLPPPATPNGPAPQGAVQVPPPSPQGTPATVLDTQDYEGVLGKGVRSAAGEDMGRIVDVILDKEGRPRAAIIDFGGFLGVGSRKIAVDWRAFKFTTDGKPGRPVLQLTRNQVRVSPEYKAGEPIVVLGPASPGGAPEGEGAAALPQGDKPVEKTGDKALEKSPDR